MSRLAFLAVLLVACSGTNNKGLTGNVSNDGGGGGAPSRAWNCSESTPGQSCACLAYSPTGHAAFSSNALPSCSGYSCCFISGADTQAECQCLQSPACGTEVSSRQGATLVSECPPPGEQAPVRCAKEGENCRVSYLSQQMLEGCCSGLVCKADSSGVPLCQTGTADEIALAAQCVRATHSIGDMVMLTDTVQTSSGPLSIGAIYVGLNGSTAGPGGCLVDIVVTVGVCDLELGPARDATGAYVVTEKPNSVCAAGGFGVNIAGTATFNGFSCEHNTDFCYAGTFEFRLTSTSAGLIGTPGGALTGAPFHVSGTFCPFQMKMAATCSGSGSGSSSGSGGSSTGSSSGTSSGSSGSGSGGSSNGGSSSGVAPCTTCTSNSQCSSTCGPPTQTGYNWCCTLARCTSWSGACGQSSSSSSGGSSSSSSGGGVCGGNMQPCCSGAVKCPNSNGMLCLTNICI